MQTHLLLQKYLKKNKNSVKGFSLRSLAAELEVSHSFLSRVFRGEKPIPYRLLLKLGKLLDIEPEVFASLKEAHQEIQDSQAVAPVRGKASIKSSLTDWELAPEVSHRVLRNWFYLPILDMTTLINYDGSVETLARRLNIAKATAQVAVNDLLSLGLLKLENGKLVKNIKKVRWNTSASLDDIRSFHDQMLEKAQKELRSSRSEQDFNRRLITGITLTASPEKIERAKKKLAEALHEIAGELVEEQGSEVYHLAAQLFPLTK